MHASRLMMNECQAILGCGRIEMQLGSEKVVWRERLAETSDLARPGGYLARLRESFGLLRDVAPGCPRLTPSIISGCHGWPPAVGGAHRKAAAKFRRLKIWPISHDFFI